MENKIEKIKLVISKDLWEYINEYMDLSFAQWPTNFKHEFNEIKIKYADKNIILSKNDKKSIWKIDRSKNTISTNLYRFKNQLIAPEFSNKNITTFTDKVREKNRTKEELDDICNKLLNYISTYKPNGITYMDMSRFIVERYLGETFNSSQKHGTAIIPFLQRLKDAGVIKDKKTGKYFYKKPIHESYKILSIKYLFNEACLNK